MGIAGFSAPETIRYIRLISGFPGEIAGPWIPPVNAASRVLKSSLESWSAAPWHFQQALSNIGWMSFENETVFWL